MVGRVVVEWGLQRAKASGRNFQQAPARDVTRPSLNAILALPLPKKFEVFHWPHQNYRLEYGAVAAVGQRGCNAVS